MSGQDLITQSETTGRVTAWSEPQLPTSLARRIDEARDVGFLNLDVITPEENAAFLELLPRFQAGIRGTEPDDIARMYGSIALLHPEGKMSEREQAAKLKLYIKTLKDIPPDLLAQAFLHCAQNLKFFPKPAEIREAILTRLARRRELCRTIHSLTFKHKLEWKDPGPPPPPPTEEEIKQSNFAMRMAGLKTRFHPDGSIYQLELGDEDPAPLPPQPELKKEAGEDPLLPLQ